DCVADRALAHVVSQRGATISAPGKCHAATMLCWGRALFPHLHGSLHHDGVQWCKTTRESRNMATKKPRLEEERMKPEAALRASVSFPPELYHLLERIASKKKVSIAWVVRDAAEKYVAEQWPLLGGRE